MHEEINSAYTLIRNYETGAIVPSTEITQEQARLIRLLATDLKVEADGLDIGTLVSRVALEDTRWNREALAAVCEFHDHREARRVEEADAVRSRFVSRCPSVGYWSPRESLTCGSFRRQSWATGADLRRWNGVRRDSRLHAKEFYMEQEIKLGALGQIARTVKDIKAARGWYGEVLGLPHMYSFGNLAFFDCGGVRLFLSEGEGPASESILYFQVEDVRAAHSALTARDVQFTHAPPHMVHRRADGQEEWMAVFNDNEGRPLAIMSTVRG